MFCNFCGPGRPSLFPTKKESAEAKKLLPSHILDIVTAMQPAVIKAMAGKDGSMLDRAIVENVIVQKLALQ